MAIKRSKAPTGTVVILEHQSRVLRDNPWGDPHVRKLAVWLPPQYDEGRRPRKQPPLPGALRPGRLHRLGAFAHQLEAVRRQRARARGAAHPRRRRWGRRSSCFRTASRRSAATSTSTRPRSATTRTISRARSFRSSIANSARSRAREHRGCFGKSSGGYGAIIHGMKYANDWGAIADHSGDAYFDFVYWHDWPNTLNELAKHRAPKRKPGAYDARAESSREGLAEGLDDGRIKRFLAHVWKKEKASRLRKATAS